MYIVCKIYIILYSYMACKVYFTAVFPLSSAAMHTTNNNIAIFSFPFPYVTLGYGITEERYDSIR